MAYEEKKSKNIKRNEKYLEGFEIWLTQKNLVPKTIKNHLANTELFINDYLNYNEIIKAEDGLPEIYIFRWVVYHQMSMGIQKLLKKTLASLKKFYQYMSENNYVDATEYQNTFSFLKDNMDEILESIDDFADFDEDDLYSIF